MTITFSQKEENGFLYLSINGELPEIGREIRQNLEIKTELVEQDTERSFMSHLLQKFCTLLVDEFTNKKVK